MAVVATAASALALGIAPAPAATAQSRPNILFVLTDDLDTAELQFMPHTLHLIAGGGATFDNYFVSDSLCCPSRTTTIRGQYAHNTGVWSNGGTNGGFERAYSEGIEQDTVATRLHDAGYRTALLGKYLNGYPNTAPIRYVPPGWTSWASPVLGHPYGEYDYSLNLNGLIEHFGRAPRDYGTTVYMQRARHFMLGAIRAHQPFFTYLAVYAPHQPATPAPQDVAKFANARVPRTPAYDQADVSTMPRYIQDLPRFTPSERAAIDDLYRLRIRSLQAVDRGVASLVQTLRSTGQLDNTYIVFTSDNGFHLGQHRLPAGKQTPYDTDTHVPMLVRGPGIAPGSHVSGLTGNIDLAPTFERMAGVRPPSFTDGRDMLGLARDNAHTIANWRNAYLIEHRAETLAGAPPRKRSLPLEPPDPDQAGIDRIHHIAHIRHSRPPHAHPWPRSHGHLVEPRDDPVLERYAPIPDYDAVRTTRYLYVEYATGERELYDTRVDPEEIHNLAGTQPSLEHALAVRITHLQSCRGATCRIADSSRTT